MYSIEKTARQYNESRTRAQYHSLSAESIRASVGSTKHFYCARRIRSLAHHSRTDEFSEPRFWSHKSPVSNILGPRGSMKQMTMKNELFVYQIT